jgi:hypothetical protein
MTNIIDQILQSANFSNPDFIADAGSPWVTLGRGIEGKGVSDNRPDLNNSIRRLKEALLDASERTEGECVAAPNTQLMEILKQLPTALWNGRNEDYLYKTYDAARIVVQAHFDQEKSPDDTRIMENAKEKLGQMIAYLPNTAQGLAAKHADWKRRQTEKQNSVS